MNLIESADDYKKYLDMIQSHEFLELEKIYTRQTMFDILGVARQENPHSSFIKWLLDPEESHGLHEIPFRKLMQTLCFAYVKHDNCYLNTENETYKKENSAERRKCDDCLLFFKNKKGEQQNQNVISAFMYGKYKIIQFEIFREYTLEEKRRADIFLKFTIEVNEGGEKRRCLMIIENKITSGENREQTDAYMKYMLEKVPIKKNNKDTYDIIIPVYLYPANNEEITKASDNKKIPCKNGLFLLLNYQYLLDGVIIPCKEINENKKVDRILSDYISCLGKSIDVEINDKSDKNTKNQNAKQTDIVMAVSRQEKVLAGKLWENHGEIIRIICKELLRDESTSIVTIKSDSERQLYTAILSALVHEKKDGLLEDKDLIDSAINEGKVKNKFFAKIGEKITSFGRTDSDETVGSLGYYMIKYYVINRKCNIDDVKKLRDNMLNEIHDAWLAGIIRTNEEVIPLVKVWFDVFSKTKNQICDRYYNDSVEPLGDKYVCCPLAEKKENPFKNKPNLEFINKTERCPFHKEQSLIEFCDEYLGRQGRRYLEPCCFYEFVHCYFVEDLAKKMEYQNMAFSLEDCLDKGINKSHPSVMLNDNNYIYIARFWGTSTINKLIKVLDLKDYVHLNNSENLKEMNF